MAKDQQEVDPKDLWDEKLVEAFKRAVADVVKYNASVGAGLVIDPVGDAWHSGNHARMAALEAELRDRFRRLRQSLSEAIDQGRDEYDE